MSSPIIEVRNLSKLYHLGQIGTGSLKELTSSLWDKIRGKKHRVHHSPDAHPETNPERMGPEHNTFWALKDVSFDVQQGEVLGVIGRNGAGKSTLLKILSRITEPTSGYVKMRGRVASLLEVGTGFHEELTGRHNIYLNGAILGMRRKEIDRKLDEIVDFSGVEKFLDTPVKRYSSGMRVRLAFAVAAHLDPEILILDEVLAVGDAEFQRKCLGKMKEVSTEEGRTVLFVSHNIAAIRSLCNRVVLLRGGQLAANAATSDGLHIYQNQYLKEALHRQWNPPQAHEPLAKLGLYLKEARVLSNNGIDHTINVTTDFSLAFCVHADRETVINLSPHFLGSGSEVVFASPSHHQRLHLGCNWFICKIPGSLLNDSVYSVQAMIVEDSSVVQVVSEALIFEVHDLHRGGNWHGKWPGVVRPALEWDFAAPGTNPGLTDPIPVTHDD